MCTHIADSVVNGSRSITPTLHFLQYHQAEIENAFQTRYSNNREGLTKVITALDYPTISVQQKPKLFTNPYV